MNCQRSREVFFDENNNVNMCANKGAARCIPYRVMSPYTKILSLHFRILPPLFLKNFRFPHQSVPFFCIFSPQKVVYSGPQLGDLSLDTIAPKPTWKIETITIVFKILWIVRSWHFVIHAVYDDQSWTALLYFIMVIQDITMLTMEKVTVTRSICQLSEHLHVDEKWDDGQLLVKCPIWL